MPPNRQFLSCNGLLLQVHQFGNTRLSQTQQCQELILAERFALGRALNFDYATCAGQVTPGVELCNGFDDDCDGVTDEDYASVPTTCGVGACSSTGTTCWRPTCKASPTRCPCW